MVLEFMELEDHGKFDFAKFEYPKSDKSLYISETIADCNIICKKMLFGYFRTKWVFTHKNPTIQLVGPVLKQYVILATRASEARFRGPKSSL